jgi:putative heme-binding domain-containing protein
MKLLAFAASALLLSSSVAAAQTAPSPSQRASAQLQAGATRFSMTCRVCHGDAGIGGVAPALRGAKFTASYVSDVMKAGRPGTMMPAFAGKFSDTEIAGVARYIVSLQQPTGGPQDTLHGDPAAGERIFFAAAANSCHQCHALRGRGGSVGPDLAMRVAALSPREVLDRIIVVPHRRTDRAYSTVQIRTKGGLLLNGIKAGENADVVNFYDTATLPPILRVIRKDEIVESNVRPRTSVMPTDYAARLSLRQLLDLVAFLKSVSAPQPVTLADLIK